MHFFFDGAESILRLVIIAPAAYVALVLFLRASGKRTLTELNAFDLVITVALGSTLATQILSRDTPLMDGVVAMAVLVGLQWAVTWASVRWEWLRKAVRSEATQLLHDGKFDYVALRRERVTESEVQQAVRAEGFAEISAALSVYLQSDGSLAVVARTRT